MLMGCHASQYQDGFAFEKAAYKNRQIPIGRQQIIEIDMLEHARSVTPKVITVSVPVTMMDIRKVWMVMPDRLMNMGVGVRLIGRHLLRVFMLVMFVMTVPMSVCVFFVLMAMIMAFGKVQPHARHHERCGQPEQP